MIWRVVAAIVVLFWAVMTGLLIRDIYFPDESRFAAVPPRYVFDLFLKQAEVSASTLHLYHRGEKIGHANLTIGAGGTKELKRYNWLARGVIERLQEKSARVNATWEVSGEMDEVGNWHQMELTAAMPKQEAQMTLSWKDGEKLPKVNMTQQGKTVLDSQSLAVLMAMGAGASGEWMKSFGALASEAPEAGAFQFTAREGSLELAGRERRCYLVTAPLPGGQVLRLVFAETGELARIDLPQEYRLIEPMIHGMILPLSNTATAP